MLDDIDGLVQNCSISSVLAMEILQPCTKPLIYALFMISVCFCFFQLDQRIDQHKITQDALEEKRNELMKTETRLREIEEKYYTSSSSQQDKVVEELRVWVIDNSCNLFWKICFNFVSFVKTWVGTGSWNPSLWGYEGGR